MLLDRDSVRLITDFKNLSTKQVEILNDVKVKAQYIKENGDQLTSLIKNGKGDSSLGLQIADSINSHVGDLIAMVDELTKTSNKFISDFNWNIYIEKLYNYLDSLSLSLHYFIS